VGYSFGVHARTQKLQQSMLGFLDTQYNNWGVLMGDPRFRRLVRPPTGDADYDRAANFIGFNYGLVHGWERLYIAVVCNWVALKVGRQRRRFNRDIIKPGLLTNPVPYTTYDGFMHWPILVTGTPEKLPPLQQCWATDQYGFLNGPQLFHDYASVMFSEVCVTNPKNASALFLSSHEGYQKAFQETRLDERRKSDDITFRQWHDEHTELVVESFKPLMVETFDTMRSELRRLDQVWLERPS